MKKYPELNTERLILRGFQPTDAPHIQELAGAFEVAEMTLNIPHPYLDGMAETWMSSHQSEYNSGNGVVFAMIELHSGKLVGAVGLTGLASHFGKKGMLQKHQKRYLNTDLR